MIRPEEVFHIGRISKFRGISGEVELQFTDDAFDRGTAEYFALDMDGILVPFFWEEYRFKNADTAIVKFEGIDDETAARKLVGRKVCYPKAAQGAPAEELSSWKALTGYTVTDEAGRPLGVVDNVDDTSANILLYLLTPGGKELIIPFHDDFLVDYSLAERVVRLRLPDGLVGLNG